MAKHQGGTYDDYDQEETKKAVEAAMVDYQYRRLSAIIVECDITLAVLRGTG